MDGQERTTADADAQEQDARFDHRKRSPSAAEVGGFSVHAGVHIDVLRCPTCDGRVTLIAAITQRDVAERILTHLRLPLEPEVLSDGHTIAYDITGQPLLDAELVQDKGPWHRAPPDG